jgi:hypothetical protein
VKNHWHATLRCKGATRGTAPRYLKAFQLSVGLGCAVAGGAAAAELAAELASPAGDAAAALVAAAAANKAQHAAQAGNAGDAGNAAPAAAATAAAVASALNASVLRGLRAPAVATLSTADALVTLAAAAASSPPRDIEGASSPSVPSPHGAKRARTHAPPGDASADAAELQQPPPALPTLPPPFPLSDAEREQLMPTLSRGTGLVGSAAHACAADGDDDAAADCDGAGGGAEAGAADADASAQQQQRQQHAEDYISISDAPLLLVRCAAMRLRCDCAMHDARCAKRLHSPAPAHFPALSLPPPLAAPQDDVLRRVRCAAGPELSTFVSTASAASWLSCAPPPGYPDGAAAAAAAAAAVRARWRVARVALAVRTGAAGAGEVTLIAAVAAADWQTATAAVGFASNALKALQLAAPAT